MKDRGTKRAERGRGKKGPASSASPGSESLALHPSSFPLVAVDVGNQRIKCGLFAASPADETLPEPNWTLTIGPGPSNMDRLGARVADLAPAASWWIGSVNRPSAAGLVEWLRSHRPEDRIRLLAAGDLPIRVALERPDMVGIDRLLDAVAANRLRRPKRAAAVVDVGSAITVDLVSEKGEFLGGSIVPGIGMSARALHSFTDLLPLVDMSELEDPPPALGTSTVAAMRSGLFWGAVGGIRQLIAELSAVRGERCDVFLTGGAGPAVAALLGPSARHVPHLTLAGIALAAHQPPGRRQPHSGKDEEMDLDDE
jgi:type III pantothenate kinase